MRNGDQSDFLTMLGRAITRHRKRKIPRMPQTALAHTAGVQPAYISKIERGQREPPLTKLLKICSALGIPLSVLCAEIEAESGVSDYSI